MKKQLHCLILATACLTNQAFATTTKEYNDWYVGLDLNASSIENNDVTGTNRGTITFDDAVDLTDLKLGYRPQSLYNQSGAVRFEAELLTRGGEVSRVTTGTTNTKPKSDLSIGALMGNIYYDVHTNTAFTPYIGAGLGLASLRFDKSPGLGIKGKDDSDLVAAGQLALGVSYTPELLPSTSWSVGYNLFAADAAEFTNGATKEQLDTLVVNSVQLGFKYHF